MGLNYIRDGYSVSVHAEINALEKLKKVDKRRGYDLLVVKKTKANLLGESRPCMHCIQRLIKSGINIRHVYYSTKKGTIEREKFNVMLESKKTYISSGHRHRDKKK